MASKQQRIPKAELYLTITDAINRKSFCILPEFPGRFYVAEPEPGMRECLMYMDRDCVRYVSDKAVSYAILNYLHKNCAAIAGYSIFTYADCEKAADFWRGYTDPIVEPPMVKQASEPGLCFHRLPWDATYGSTPCFDEFLSRCSNGDALCAFIGSLLVPNADRQQYVYLHGDGMNGKGALLRFLARVMGPAYCAKVPPSRDDKFWNYGLLGKRLVAFPDCPNSRFPADPRFKMLTGGDAVPIERKGKDSYTAELSCKFIFASNDEPKISGQAADRRRAIYCAIEPIAGDPDPHYDDKLWAEGAGILWKCRDAYVRLARGDTPINSDSSEIGMLIAKGETAFISFFKGYFSHDARTEKICKLGDIHHFSLQELGYVCDIAKKSEEFKDSFVKWLRVRHGIVYRQVRFEQYKDTDVPEGRRRMFIGACVKVDYAKDTHMRKERNDDIPSNADVIQLRP
jgi:phage/plasmid-associated DNA primase